jgi:hypothetical protein
MRRQFAALPFIGLVALFFVSCAGGDRVPRQEQDTPNYGTSRGSDIRYQRYGPQDRAGNPTQNNLPPYGACQYATRC